MEEVVDVVKGGGVEEDILEFIFHLLLKLELDEEEEEEEVGVLLFAVLFIFMEEIAEKEGAESEGVHVGVLLEVVGEDERLVHDKLSGLEEPGVKFEDDIDDEDDGPEKKERLDGEVVGEGEVVGDEEKG